MRTPPPTRYQGSKLKLLTWLRNHFQSLDFNSALDLFGGTGTVSFLLKDLNKKVTYADYLKSNYFIGKALVENDSIKLSDTDLDFILKKNPNKSYKNHIENTFKDIYYTDEENAWLDVVIQNINSMGCEYKKANALFALFQSCIIKRPFNLFHRKNLNFRLSKIKRTFGNSNTWNKPFETHFRKFASQINDAIFKAEDCTSICCDAFDAPNSFDLVYFDSPYISGNGTPTDYYDFYHFLEGLTDYDNWINRIDYKRKHNPLFKLDSPWINKEKILNDFDVLFKKHKDSILVVSYRSDGIPSIKELTDLIKSYKKECSVSCFGKYKYVLSDNNKSEEILIIGK